MINCKPIFEEEFLEIAQNKPSGISRLGLQVGLGLQPCLADNKAGEMM
jgi:hypothetical protein